ncbi:MAG: type II toxin-antitoxin system HicB family antitoxin [Nitrospirae bacterium]|nr:type II toxin-antitoxin system HicB family antitoxin [Nitrospirota bacterium]MBF0533385.1 type II toxin-antitoxin system HicB family antitoxin [Nitrospirota bacterium]MBF0616089.1 type II toxin-antitoxin system HicB family antitoxin [Nitrospirota bacterium]
MKDVLTHKNFVGSVRFSAADMTFHGKLEGISDLVTFEGQSVMELTKAFHEAVDDYENICKEAGKKPERSYKGSFNVRIPAELHRKAIERATMTGIPLNQLVQKALEEKLSDV